MFAVGLGASRKNLKRMAFNLEAHLGANRLLLFLDFGIGKFKDLAAIFANDVVVMLVAVNALIVQMLVPKTVLANKVALDEQFEGVIDRCARDIASLLFHSDENFVGVEVPCGSIDFVQDHGAFRR